MGLKSTGLRGALCALPLITGLSAGAQAAPQILAALETLEGVSFHCADGLCKADLTTYCLQKNRPAPSAGQAYAPADPRAFTLTVTHADGKKISTPASRHLAFVEARGFMAVSGVITETALKALTKGGEARLSVARNASLIPVPDADDDDPITEREIAHVTKSLRELGGKIVDRSPKGQAARVLARVRDKLPRGAELPRAASETFWRQTIGDEPSAQTPAVAMTLAREQYDGCFQEVDDFRFSGMRQCLEWGQDHLIRDLNIDYWDNQPGS